MQATLPSGEQSALSEWTTRGSRDPADMPVLSDGVGMTWIVCVVWNVCSIPAAIPYLRKGINPHDYAAWITLGLAAVGIVLIMLSIRSILAIRKYGSSRFHLDTLPAIVGGTLRGTVHVPRGLEPSLPVTLRLTSIRITPSQGKNQSNTEHTLWKDDQTAATLSAPGNSATISVAFSIPDDARPSSKAFSEIIQWRLEARCKTPGVNYQARFEVPVFSPAAADQFPVARSIATASPQSEYHPAPPNWHSQFHEHGITYVPVAGNAWRIYFSPGRSPSTAVFFTIIGAIMTVGPIAMMRFASESFPLARPLIFSLLAIPLLIGLAFDGLAIYFSFVGTTVTVRRGSLALEFRLVLLRLWRKTFEVEQIADIVCQDGGSSTVGNRTRHYYSITLKANNGGDVDLGMMISQKEFAAWLTQEIKDTLGFNPSPQVESHRSLSDV